VLLLDEHVGGFQVLLQDGGWVDVPVLGGCWSSSAKRWRS
jgi:isopenicillin N synthase-like dioxygenase